MANDWTDTSLGDVLEFKRGYDLPNRDRRPGRIPIVSSSGVSGAHSEAKVTGPGVVTGRYGTIGQVFFIEQDYWPLNTTLYVRNFKGNDPKFISYFLTTIDYLAYSDKAAVPGVNRNHLHQARVRIPPVETQRRIAEILGAIDDKIELNRRMNETLKAMAQRLFKSWFNDFDPVHAKAALRREHPKLSNADLSRRALPNLALSDLGIYANPEGNIKLLTIHQSKGREFAAVAIFGLQDGILPYFNQYNPLTVDGEAEARRQLYVAITRAERLLAIFTTSGGWRPPCRFLAPLGLPPAPPKA